MNVETLSQEYAEWIGTWEKCRAASKGQKAIKAGRTKYLPARQGQDREDYDKLIQRALYYNATGRTVSGLLGMLFRKPAGIDIPESEQYIVNNIDLTGTDLRTFMQFVAKDIVEVSRSGVLIDYPERDEDQYLTKAQIEELGHRPYCTRYPAEQI